MWKVLSQGIHMWNMKVLSLTVHKLWPRLKFLKSRSNFKVKVTRSKIMAWCERSCHKEYTCEVWKSLSLTVHKLWPRLKFLKSRSNFKVKVTRSKIMAWCERSCHKEYTCEVWKRCLSRFISYEQGSSFWKVGQTSRSRSLGQKLWYDVKGLVTRNTHVKYESLVSHGS